MTRKRAGRARQTRGARRASSWSTSGPKNRFRKTQPNRWKWAGVPNSSSGGGSYSTLGVEGLISASNRRIRRLPGVTSDELERWYYIEAGILPPDEDSIYKVLSDDEMMERATDEIAPTEAAARKDVEDIIDNCDAEVKSWTAFAEKKQDEANELWDDRDPETMEESKREARRMEGSIILPIWDDTLPELEHARDAELLGIREALQEEREDIKRRLQKEQQESIDRHVERLHELKTVELPKELQSACDRYFEEDGLFELETWHLA